MGKGISLSDLPEPYRRQAEQKLIQEMQRRAALKPKTETANPKNPRKKEKPVKPPKLRNQKVTRGGKTFDSNQKLGRYPLEQTQVREVHQVSALRQNRHPTR